MRLVLAFVLAPLGCAAYCVAADPSACDAVVARVLTTRIVSSELDPPPEARREGFASDEAWRDHYRARTLEWKIKEPLRREFCREHHCELTSEEKRTILQQLKEGARTKGDGKGIPDDERAQEALLHMSASWKFHRALYERYGGEVIWQVLGVNAVGASRRWLEDEERRGNFEIMDGPLRDAFYKAVSGYGGRSVSPEQARETFAHPPWEPTHR